MREVKKNIKQQSGTIVREICNNKERRKKQQEREDREGDGEGEVEGEGER